MFKHFHLNVDMPKGPKNAAMPIRSPKGDLGPLGDFLVKIGPLLVPFYTKSPLSSRLYSMIWLN